MRAFVIIGSTGNNEDTKIEWTERVVWSQERAGAVVQELTERDNRLMERDLRIQADLRAWEQANPRPADYVTVPADHQSANGRSMESALIENRETRVVARLALNMDGLKDWSARLKVEENRLRSEVYPQTEHSRCPAYSIAKGDFKYCYETTEAEEFPATS